MYQTLYISNMSILLALPLTVSHLSQKHRLGYRFIMGLMFLCVPSLSEVHLFGCTNNLMDSLFQKRNVSSLLVSLCNIYRSSDAQTISVNQNFLMTNQGSQITLIKNKNSHCRCSYYNWIFGQYLLRRHIHLLSQIQIQKMMNLQHIGSHQKLGDGSDYERLVEICNSYGLDKQETEQILSQFQNGTYQNGVDIKTSQDAIGSYNDQSSGEYQESFCKQSEQQMQGSYAFKNETVKFQDEQYSFKHPNNATGRSPSGSNNSNVEHNDTSEFNPQVHRFSKRPNSKQNGEQTQQTRGFTLSQGDVQEFFVNRLQFEKRIYHDLKLQNERLLQENKLKDDKINMLMEFKHKESDIILGLKDIIAELTNQNKEKEIRYLDLQTKYQNLLQSRHQNTTHSNEYFGKQNSNKTFNADLSTERLSKQRAIPLCNKMFKAQQQMQEKVKPLGQIQFGKSSNESLDIIAKCQIQNPLGQLRKDSSRSKGTKDDLIRRNNRIDISKYKGMIQELRNSYHKGK